MLSYNRFAQPLIHHPTAVPISAVFRLRYHHTLMREVGCIWACNRRAPSTRHAAGGMVIGADGDSKVRSG